ncbi:iron complex outermembrane recepter protein [Bergeyella porcorum]|uniref:Iron complex outermembrane recepter protein n=1 Tax=Bergeyella porcorum TaxID=1735111 RepID=A0AAU0F1X8_9FLAO
MKLTLNFLFFILGITILSAQNTFKIYGVVQDFHDKTLLKNAKIKLGNRTTLSDEKGQFVLPSVEAGQYTLVVSHSACDDFSQELKVDKDLYLNISLEHHIEEIETVALRGTKKPSGSVVITTLDRKWIDRNATENLGNFLSKASGVSSMKTGNNITKPIIHGLYGSRVSIINDGVKMAEQEWGVEHAPSVEPTAFERISVIKGSGVLKYSGDAVGGVIVLEPKLFPARDSLVGGISLSGISNGRGAKLGVNLAKTWENRWFVKTMGTYQKLGDLAIPKHTLQNTGAEENSFHFSFGHRAFTQGFEVSYSGVNQNFGIFTGSHLGGPEDFYNAMMGGASAYWDNFSYKINNPKQEVSHHLAKIEAYKRFFSLGKLSFQYAFQDNHRKEYDIRRGELNGKASMDLRLTTHQAKLEHLIEREQWQLESGILGTFQNNFPNPATEVRRLIPDYKRYDAGVYSVLSYQPNARWKTEAGIRYDFNRYDVYKYYDNTDWERRYATIFPQFEVSRSGSRILTRPVFNFHNISLNAGVAYQPSQHWNMKLNLSRASRTPNAAELFADGLHHSASIIEQGDLSLRKEEVYQATLSVKAELDVLAGLQWEVNPYIMFSDNFINQLPVGVENTNRGVFMIWNYQQTRARIWGLDADVELKIHQNMKWNSRFSTLRGDDVKHHETMILMMPAQFKNAIEWTVIPKSKLYIRLENETVLKQNRYPIRNIGLTMIENGSVVTKTLDVSTPPAGYSVFHAGAGVDLLQNLSVNFKINNIFNTEYRDYLNRLRFFAPELGRNLILTFNYKF